jgi:hypothetical protein
MLRNLYILLILIISSGNLLSQTLTGTVYDENKNPVPGVAVYFSGSTIGTLTDENGRYQIRLENKINSPLVISFVGYQTVVIENPFEESDHQIYLKPKTYELSEVVVRAGKFNRGQLLKTFRDQFLGTTQAGRSCRIKNEEDINLRYDYANKTLLASAQKPIIIENFFLGYQINFNLVDFKINFNRVSLKNRHIIKSFIFGTTLYRDIGNNKISIFKRRESTYSGSPMNFFRNLYNNNWPEDEFLFFRGPIPVAPKDCFIISDTLGQKKIKVLRSDAYNIKNMSKASKVRFFSTLRILYHSKERSNIIFRTETFLVDKFGNDTAYDLIEINGDMAKKRIGDLLPMDYKSGK